MLVCLGDSLTFGSYGYSYIEYLPAGIKAVNKGKNGDTVVGAYKRLCRIIDSPRYKDAKTYVVGIGTNDILLPYLCGVSKLWDAETRIRAYIKGCITDDSAFKAEYEKIPALLKQHGKRIIIFGMPFIQIADFPNDRVQKRNAEIKELAEKYGADYIDIFALQKQTVPEAEAKYSWKDTNLIRMLDSTAMMVMHSTGESFSKMRNLELTVDGVHFNRLSAELLGGEVTNLILKQKSAAK